MNASDYLVDFLIQHHVTDAFGIPGGVILDLLYALDRRKGEITPHLNYHEQGAAFAACGYAQATGTLGVAYATRGPGIANMVTAVADAYCDSIPVLFITAHSLGNKRTSARVETDQELDFIPMLSGITKYAARIDRAEDLCPMLKQAYLEATSGRLGPVVLDISTRVLSTEITSLQASSSQPLLVEYDAEIAARCVTAALKHALRPVFLIGDGVNQSHTGPQVRTLAELVGIPVLSSRFSQDVMPDSTMSFGYIGSHAARYANFILSKADLIVTLGNRMSFPVDSLSYRPLLERTQTIRIDIDETELLREIPNSRSFNVSLAALLPRLQRMELTYEGRQDWLNVCRTLKSALWEQDTGFPICVIAGILREVDPSTVVVCDVGNHEMWLSRAYAYARTPQRILYSKSFGALGCALAKAIGAYYATRRPVICFTGDQGLQMNIQELQFIAQHKLPVTIVLLNNASSGMIRSREAQHYDAHFVHTTLDSGYGTPNFAALARAYGLDYLHLTEGTVDKAACAFCSDRFPRLVELSIDEGVDISPYLPRGNPLQALIPALPEDVYRQLDNL